MPELKKVFDFEAPAQKLFDLLADFGAIQSWWPTDGPVVIERVENEGSGVGMVRHIYNKGFTETVDERLDYLDPDTMTFKLSLIGTPPGGIRKYQATGVIKETAPGKSCLEYTAVFETDPGEEENAANMLGGMYAIMAQGLADKLAETA